MQLPAYVQIEPVGRCNLACEMCAVRFRDESPPALMAWELFTRIVDEIPTLETLHLQGLGEPTLHPRFFEMVRYAARRGIRVTTNTNLTLLNARSADAWAGAGLHTIHVSIDGATAPTYESIRVNASYRRVTENLCALLEARQRLGRNTPRIHLVAVLMRRNLAELPGLVRLAARWGVDRLFVQQLCHDFVEGNLPEAYRPMREFVATEALYQINPEEVEGTFAEARALAYMLGVDLRLPRARPRPHPHGLPGRERCDWPWNGAYVTYDGQMMPCCMISTPDRARMGSLSEGHVVEIWNGPRYREFRAALDSPTPPEVCRACALYRGTF